MPAKKQTPTPSPEACQELLRIIEQSRAPLTVKACAGLLTAPHQIPPKLVGTILEQYVATGRLHRLGGGTPAKTFYWDRDLHALRRAAMREILERANDPLTAREIVGQLHPPVQCKEPELLALLQDELSQGRAHAIPPKTAKGKPRFWRQDSRTYGRAALLGALQKGGPLPEAKLKKGAPGLSPELLDDVFQSLLAERAVWRHPPIGKPAKELFGCRPPSPEPYLRDLGLQLTHLVERLLAASVPRDDLRRALVQLMEAAGIPFASAGAMAPAAATEPPPAAVDLIALIRRLEPGADQGARVGARDQRRAAQLDKPTFDQAVLSLARAGRLSLHRHDFVANLTPQEREELVTDNQGNYYVGVALRQPT
ncbi:MAG: hypothetical protein ACKV0T_30895 [Planctomycetales bacterium]